MRTEYIIFLNTTVWKSGRRVTGVLCPPEKAWMDAKARKGTDRALNFKSSVSDSSKDKGKVIPLQTYGAQMVLGG
jgi:hypothetical protein